jgi:hypothetical protein
MPASSDVVIHSWTGVACAAADAAQNRIPIAVGNAVRVSFKVISLPSFSTDG